MSNARSSFLKEISALESATAMAGVAAGAGPLPNPGVVVLRRGASIAAAVMLETFIRDRTEELLTELGNWTGRFEDFPDNFRKAATLTALGNLEKYSRMQERQQEDFETEILDQIRKMSSTFPPVFRFSKYIVGDYTGNISHGKLKEIFRIFQIGDCWNSLRRFSADIGFGIPSVEMLLKDLMQDRHRSAHIATHTPTAGDILELPRKLVCLGVCFDSAMSASVTTAVSNSRAWINGAFDWRTNTELFFLEPSQTKFRLLRPGATRALRVLDQASDAPSYLPMRRQNTVRVIVERKSDLTPVSWDIRN